MLWQLSLDQDLGLLLRLGFEKVIIVMCWKYLSLAHLLLHCVLQIFACLCDGFTSEATDVSFARVGLSAWHPSPLSVNSGKSHELLKSPKNCMHRTLLATSFDIHQVETTNLLQNDSKIRDHLEDGRYLHILLFSAASKTSSSSEWSANSIYRTNFFNMFLHQWHYRPLLLEPWDAQIATRKNRLLKALKTYCNPH